LKKCRSRAFLLIGAALFFLSNTEKIVKFVTASFLTNSFLFLFECAIYFATFFLFQPLILHLLDIAPMMGVLNGVVMEIDVRLPITYNKLTIDQSSSTYFGLLDFVCSRVFFVSTA
jgi:hypothetical protein